MASGPNRVQLGFSPTGRAEPSDSLGIGVIVGAGVAVLFRAQQDPSSKASSSRVPSAAAVGASSALVLTWLGIPRCRPLGDGSLGHGGHGRHDRRADGIDQMEIFGFSCCSR